MPTIRHTSYPSLFERDFIQSYHQKEFNIPVRYISGDIWFFYEEERTAYAFARCHNINQQNLFFGPCIVLPEYRGNGIQRKLIMSREKYGIAMGYRTALTFVEKDNTKSCNNFIKCGFLMADPFDFIRKEWGAENYIYFTKSLIVQ